MIGALGLASFGSLKIVQVEPGHVVEHKGEKLTVDHNSAVFRNGTVVVTARTWERMKAELDQLPAGGLPQ